MKNKCQCPDDASNNILSKVWFVPEEYVAMKHKPNECRGTYKLALYTRDGRELWLCSCCCQPLTDRKVEV